MIDYNVREWQVNGRDTNASVKEFRLEIDLKTRPFLQKEEKTHSKLLCTHAEYYVHIISY